MKFKVADLCDENYEKELQVLSPRFKNLGGKKTFHGIIQTIKLDKCNRALIELLQEKNGKGKVLIVDAQEKYYAIIGDKLASLAQKAKYEAIVLNGYIRDISEIKKFTTAIIALGTCPLRYLEGETTRAQRDLVLEFGNIQFRNNEYIYYDEDGLIVCSQNLL